MEPEKDYTVLKMTECCAEYAREWQNTFTLIRR